MARGRKRKQGKRVEPQRDDVTPERAQHNEFISAGMARRVKPVIEIMFDAGQLTQAEYDALAYYRDQASIADKSPVRSCCDMSPRGGNGPGVTILSAQIETGRMEREMGQLWELARAVAVDDKSLTQWCIERHGGREKGDRIVVRGSDETVKRRMDIARMELRWAAWAIAPHAKYAENRPQKPAQRENGPETYQGSAAA